MRITEAIAPEGQAYTQVEDVDIQSRILATKLYFAVNDNSFETKWKLLSEEETTEYKKQQKEYFEAQEAQRAIDEQNARMKINEENQ
jgi:hypothetical protein